MHAAKSATPNKRRTRYEITEPALDDVPEDIERVDLIFRPSSTVAEQSVDIGRRIYGGPEIILRDVPLKIDAPDR
jgi:hypothetical protein